MSRSLCSIGRYKRNIYYQPHAPQSLFSFPIPTRIPLIAAPVRAWRDVSPGAQ